MKKYKIIKNTVLAILISILVFYAANWIIWQKVNDVIEKWIVFPENITIEYNGETVQTDHIYADIWAHMTIGDKKLTSYSSIDSEKKLVITSEKIYIEVYDKDNRDIYLYARLNNIITPTYIVEGVGNFSRILDELYELTENPVFNEK